MDPPQGRTRLLAELVQARFVDKHDVGRGDDIAEAPAQLPKIPRSNGLDRHRIIQALPSQQALVSRPRRSMDRDDHEGLSERLSEHLELRPAAEAVDHDAVSVDSRQRALRPDSESVSLPLRLGHAPDRGIGDREASTLGFFPNDSTHPNDGEAEVLCDDEDFLLPASRHSSDADDLHAARKWKAGLRGFPRDDHETPRRSSWVPRPIHWTVQAHISRIVSGVPRAQGPPQVLSSS